MSFNYAFCVTLGILVIQSVIGMPTGNSNTCVVNGVTHPMNEKFRLGNYEAMCTPQNLELVGCAYTTANGENFTLKAGDTKTDGTKTHMCIKNPKTGRPQYMFENSVCERDGKTYKKGETWTERNYKVKCDDRGFVVIVSCITTTGEVVGLNEKKIDQKGRVAHCQSFGNVVYYNEYLKRGGQNRSRTQPAPEQPKEPCINDANETQSAGTKWTENNMMYLCNSQNSKIAIGCTTRNKGEKQYEIHANQGLVVNGVEYSCIKDSNGKLVYNEKVLSQEHQKCIEDEKSYDIGQEWKGSGNKPFAYFCNQFGAVEITGCLLPDGTKFGTGEDKTVDNMVHKCIREGDKVTYKTEVVK